MADGNVLDTLQINIEANSANATRAISDLKSALSGLNRYLGAVDKSGNNSASKLANSLNKINGALGSLTTGNIKRVQKLANALNELAGAARKLKDIGGINVPNVSEANVKASSAAQSAIPIESVSTSSTKGGKAELEQIKLKTREMKKLGNETEKAGKKAEKASGGFSKLMKAFGRIALYRALRAVIKSITDAFSEGLKNAYEFEREANGPIFKALNSLKSTNSQLINQLGAAWGSFITAIAPYLISFMNKMIDGLQNISRIFAILNGESQYLVANKIELEWNEATDAVKQYRDQLLGLDELNNLSMGDSSKSATGVDTKDLFHYEDVGKLSPDDWKIIDWFNKLKKAVEDVIWAVSVLIQKLKEDLNDDTLWDKFWKKVDPSGETKRWLKNVGLAKLKEALLDAWDLFKVVLPGMAELWADFTGVLTLGPAYALVKSGIKKMIKKLKSLFPSLEGLNFKEKWKAITDIFTWNNVLEGFKIIWRKIKEWWGTNITKYFNKQFWESKWKLVKEAFAPENIWGNFVTGLKAIWKDITQWWNNNVAKVFTKKFWTDLFGNIKKAISDFIGGLKDNKEPIMDFYITSNSTGGGGRSRIETKAVGGTVTQGSLFYAGEAGPEFVGSIGGTSAVANTSQMTEAIESAAYKGMARALSQYGGGMSGYEPATTDDLFVVLRKKAKNYTRMTGKMAF